MATRRSREAALSDLVAGLLDARLDPATDRFDAELAAAEEDGRIDTQTAKVLRWWQREAQRAVVEHARIVLPPTLLALEQAAAGADREAEASAASWARATADEQPDDDGGTSPRGVRTRPSASRTGSAAADQPQQYVDEGAEWSTEEDTEDTDEDTDDETDDEDGDSDDRYDTDEQLTPPADLSEHRRRLLVAGLTRVRTQH
jgi:hypothetical protein